MASILQKIVDTKRAEIAAKSRLIDINYLRRYAENNPIPCLSMSESIRRKPIAIIAEHKRRSPSQGDINRTDSVERIVKAYEADGAAACSILTDTRYFGGSLTDLAIAREKVKLPLLRKDFIIDPYQVYEARVYGADAILLIGSILSEYDAALLTELAHSLSLEVLFEIYEARDLAVLPPHVEMIGINSRDLGDFSTDINHATNLVKILPDNVIRVAESGIKNVGDVRRLHDAGYNAFLVGTALASGKTSIPCLTYLPHYD